MSSIPVVALSDYASRDEARRARFVRELGGALRDFGFVSVTDRGIAPERIRDAYAVAAEFFALPPSEKKKSVIEGSKGNRGFVAFGAEHAKNRKVADLKEFFHLGRDLPELGPGGANAFPSAVPRFAPATRALFDDLEGVSSTLLTAIYGIPDRSATAGRRRGARVRVDELARRAVRAETHRLQIAVRDRAL